MSLQYGDSIELSDGTHSILVEKVVSKGERVKISDGTDSTNFDALLLESLTWYPDRSVLAALLEASDQIAADPTDPSGGTPVSDANMLTVANEYSRITISKVQDGEHEALRLLSPTQESDITLGVKTLQTLAAVENTFVFSEWFLRPFGPEDEDEVIDPM
ncbi:hypothetical protein [Halorientalis sp.]|jgi:hypothetical protein|uniref:hypothetical protein n=1 Tax=Halorientalis sp. TaxID=1931229 RepID=UPI00262DE013|nr:hypothetical protein [Halorientalis sp.]